MICSDCPINVAYNSCYWLNADKSCRLKAEQARVREQAEADRKVGENMRDYWMHLSDGAERC